MSNNTKIQMQFLSEVYDVYTKEKLCTCNMCMQFSFCVHIPIKYKQELRLHFDIADCETCFLTRRNKHVRQELKSLHISSGQSSFQSVAKKWIRVKDMEVRSFSSNCLVFGIIYINYIICVKSREEQKIIKLQTLFLRIPTDQCRPRFACPSHSHSSLTIYLEFKKKYLPHLL